MNMNQFTLKSQEIINQAVEMASSGGRQAVESGHLLKSLLSDEHSVAVSLLRKLNVSVPSLVSSVEKLIGTYPVVSGGEPYLSQGANKAIQKAIQFSKEQKDQFVSAEHLFAGLL